MKFYNTLNRKKEEFKPLNKGKVGLYTCGPTVYAFAHIGNPLHGSLTPEQNPALDLRH